MQQPESTNMCICYNNDQYIYTTLLIDLYDMLYIITLNWRGQLQDYNLSAQNNYTNTLILNFFVYRQYDVRIARKLYLKITSSSVHPRVMCTDLACDFVQQKTS